MALLDDMADEIAQLALADEKRARDLLTSRAKQGE